MIFLFGFVPLDRRIRTNLRHDLPALCFPTVLLPYAFEKQMIRHFTKTVSIVRHTRPRITATTVMYDYRGVCPPYSIGHSHIRILFFLCPGDRVAVEFYMEHGKKITSRCVILPVNNLGPNNCFVPAICAPR